MATTPSTPAPKTNRIGLEVLSYKGGKTTLCAGCGHNAISERIVECFYELGVEPWKVAKFSGVLPGNVARVQLGARADAVRGDWRGAGEPADPRRRSHRRRRYGVDRPG